MWTIGSVAWDAVPAWWVVGIPLVLTLGWTAALVGWTIGQGAGDGGRILLAFVVATSFTLLAGAVAAVAWRTIQGRA